MDVKSNHNAVHFTLIQCCMPIISIKLGEMSATWVNKLHSIAPCCPFHTSPPCIHVRHTLPCLNLPIPGIHREGEGSLVLPQPSALTQWVFYLGLTRQSHLLLQPIPVSTELTNPSLCRCCEMHLLSMDELHAFSCILSFCPQSLFPRVKHTSCVCSHISVSSQHPTPHTALTHYTPKSKYCLKFSVLFT